MKSTKSCSSTDSSCRLLLVRPQDTGVGEGNYWEKLLCSAKGLTKDFYSSGYRSPAQLPSYFRGCQHSSKCLSAMRKVRLPHHLFWLYNALHCLTVHSIPFPGSINIIFRGSSLGEVSPWEKGLFGGGMPVVECCPQRSLPDTIFVVFWMPDEVLSPRLLNCKFLNIICCTFYWCWISLYPAFPHI